MKKFTLIFGLVLFLLTGSKGQNETEVSTPDFSFKIEFYPSFIASCRVEIQKKGNNQILTINNLFDASNPRFKATGNESIESKYQLLRDSTYLKYYGDTILVGPLEQVSISKDVFQSFLRSLQGFDLNEQESLIKEGILDGITINLNHSKVNNENNFSLRCPTPSDIQFIIIKSLFELFESTFHKQATQNYIENLKGYFEDLIEENDQIFWLVSEHSIRQVKEIGVRKSRIFKSRKSLEKAIKAQ